MSFKYTDQTGRTIFLDSTPKRIVSLIPSITELLFDLGLGDNIVGVTNHCAHPEGKVEEKADIGSTRVFCLEAIKETQPDLIIASKGENPKKGIRDLEKEHQVYLSNVCCFDDAIELINSVGTICEKEKEAKQIADTIINSFADIPVPTKQRKAAYFVWRNPYISINGKTFVNNMMEKAGFENVFAGKGHRFPKFYTKELQEFDPEYILLSSEPYPFNKKHIDEALNVFPNAKVLLVNGEMFGWYGSRMLLAADYFKTLL